MAYGLEVYDASGTLRVGTTSSFVAQGAYYANVTVLSGSSSPAYTVPGIDNTGTWKALTLGAFDLGGGDTEVGSLTYTINATNETITFNNSSGNDWNGYFLIFRDGTNSG